MEDVMSEEDDWDNTPDSDNESDTAEKPTKKRKRVDKTEMQPTTNSFPFNATPHRPQTPADSRLFSHPRAHTSLTSSTVGEDSTLSRTNKSDSQRTRSSHSREDNDHDNDDEESLRDRRKLATNEVKKVKERQRRSNMSASIQELRRLIPACREDRKANQSVVMAHAVQYIKELEERLNSVQQENERLLRALSLSSQSTLSSTQTPQQGVPQLSTLNVPPAGSEMMSGRAPSGGNVTESLPVSIPQIPSLCQPSIVDNSMVGSRESFHNHNQMFGSSPYSMECAPGVCGTLALPTASTSASSTTMPTSLSPTSSINTFPTAQTTARRTYRRARPTLGNFAHTNTSSSSSVTPIAQSAAHPPSTTEVVMSDIEEVGEWPALFFQRAGPEPNVPIITWEDHSTNLDGLYSGQGASMEEASVDFDNKDIKFDDFSQSFM